MFNPDKYRSVKWIMGGRTYPNLDCFGTANEIRRDLGLAAWPDFAGVTKDDNGLDREARKMMLQLERCEPCVGAGVACYSGATVTHIGIVVEMGGELMVAECGSALNVTFLSIPRFKRRYPKVEFWK